VNGVNFVSVFSQLIKEVAVQEHTRTITRLRPSALWTLAALMLVFVALTACRHDGETEQTEHQLIIKQGSAVDRCRIVDANDNPSVNVDPGDWVVWSNTLGNDVVLVFGQLERLFGVQTA
jgi:hypothetical protein